MKQSRDSNSKLGYLAIISTEMMSWTGLGVWGAYLAYSKLKDKYSELLVLALVLMSALTGLSIGVYRVFLLMRKFDD